MYHIQNSLVNVAVVVLFENIQIAANQELIARFDILPNFMIHFAKQMNIVGPFGNDEEAEQAEERTGLYGVQEE